MTINFIGELYAPEEFKNILLEAGYEIRIAYGNWESASLDDEAPSLLLCASIES